MNIRSIILKELRRQGKTRNWLAVQAGFTQPGVYQYLNGTSDMTGERIAKLLDVLGMKIMSSGDDKQAKKNR